VTSPLPELCRFVDALPEAIAQEDLSLLRRYGLYTQRPAGDGFFMVRIRIPGGDLTPTRLETIADLASKHGRAMVDITVRQNLQLHWIRRESIPEILDRLNSVGLSTAETCGDTARNIVNCPVSGVDGDELYDTTGIIRELSTFLTGNQNYRGLPRKLKIAITGCSLLCVYPEINDIGIFAVRGPDGDPVFRVSVGGGLSTSPRFARDLGISVRPWEVVEVCAAIASVLSDRSRGRNSRDGAYFTVPDSELHDFRRCVETRIGRRFQLSEDRGPSGPAPKDRSHVGIHHQHTGGLYYVGLSITGGRTSSADLKNLSQLASKYGSGRVRTTNSQNVILLDIARRNLAPLTLELRQAGFDYQPAWATKGLLACTGIQFCKLALTETKSRAAELGHELEKRLELDEPIRISVTGCPNSCGQHHICDVGLEGSLTTVDGVKQEAFQVFLGGGVGSTQSFGRRVGARIPADRLAGSLTALFMRYKELRSQQETFQDFCRRHSDGDLAAFLRSDEPPQPGPHQLPLDNPGRLVDQQC